MTTYPQRLAVVPVPEMVLFPHAHLPLHVSESRRQALVDQALERGSRLVMAVRRPGPELDEHGLPNVYATAGAGRIVRNQPLPGGGAGLIVRGERVVRIRDFEGSGPFRIANLTVSKSEGPPVFRERGAERLAELRALIERCCPGTYEKLRPSLFRAPETDGGLELVNTLAACFPVQVQRKLEWLAAPTPELRWEEVLDTLRRRCEERERRGQVMSRYSDLRSEDPGHN